MNRHLFAIFTIFFALTSLQAFAGAPPAEQVDRLFAEWNKPDSPGCSIAVIRDGKIVYKRAYGMADLERNVANSPVTVFDIGSVSKQFTAMSVLIAAKQEKLSLNDDIRKYLPEIRDYEKTITISHLIYHTSGLRDYLTLQDLSGMRTENEYSEGETVDLIAHQRELNFLPGEEHLYSNSGYFLLSQIIKRATGKTLREFASENIFQPLEMKNTHFHDNFREIVKNRAVGYSPKEGGGFQLDMSWYDVVGDGSLMTTVEDLYLWDQNFYHNKLAGGSQELIEQMLTPGVLNRGEKLDYAFALIHSTYRGLKTISHGGSWVGYRAQLIRFPDQKFSVICLANLGTFDPSRMAKKVADLYLAEQFKQSENIASTQKPKIEVADSVLQNRIGAYRNPESGSVWTIVLEKKKLVVHTDWGIDLNMVAVGQDEFRAKDSPYEVTMQFDQTDLRVLTDDEKPETYQRVQLVTPTQAELESYAGEYYSDELDIVYLLEAKDGTLSVKVRRTGEPVALRATVIDEFSIQGAILHFEHENNRVTGFRINAGRVKNIRFVLRS